MAILAFGRWFVQGRVGFDGYLLNDNDIDYLWRVIIILGFSCQSQYIKVLQDIKTNDSFIKKEISDAIYELKMGYKII